MKKLLKNKFNKGMTLVEVVVSIALLSIILTILSTTFMATYNMLMNAQNKTKYSGNAAAGIELTTASASIPSNVSVSSVSSTFTITFSTPAGTSTETVSGNYVQGSTASSGVTYNTFIPN
jgi:prepilin-type N-terminal cleavage/methylation domain-containing protein